MRIFEGIRILENIILEGVRIFENVGILKNTLLLNYLKGFIFLYILK